MESRQTLPAGSLKVRLFFKAPAISGRFFLDFPKSGQFRAENDRIAAIGSQTLRETAGLRQSGAKLFGKRQDCSNPEPNTSGNGKIAAIRHFPDRTSRDFPNPRIPQTRLAPLHPPMKPRAAPDCRNPEPHHAPRPHLSAAAPMPAAAGRLSPRLRRCLPMGARASPRQASGGGNAGFRAQSGGDPSEAE